MNIGWTLGGSFMTFDAIFNLELLDFISHIYGNYWILEFEVSHELCSGYVKSSQLG